MKKFADFLKGLMVAILALLIFPVMAMAQDSGGTLPGLDLNSYFASLGALVPLVVFLTAWLKKITKATGGLAQIFSWLVSIALVFGAWILKIGMFADVAQWWICLIYGFAVGLAANGIFDIKIIQSFLAVLKLEKKKV